MSKLITQLGGEQFIIRTNLLNLKFTCKFLNLIRKRLKFTWKIWISFGNIRKSFGHFWIWPGNWLDIYERGSLVNLLTLLLIFSDSKPKALEILLKLGVKENMKKVFSFSIICSFMFTSDNSLKDECQR